MLRWMVIFVLLMAGSSSVRASHHAPEPVRFTREFSSIDGKDLNLNWRETWRIEHFLRSVFPSREMYRFERHERSDWSESDAPLTRAVDYALIEQEGYRFVLVHFTLSREDDPGTSVLAVYRLERDGPNQVWRSRPWEGTYSGFRFQTAKIGWRNVILFEEGGEDNGFGLAGIFSFHNADQGLYLRVLTPEMPRLRAITRFPIRPMLARNISLDAREVRGITLAASDEAFTDSRPAAFIRRWFFNARRGIFEVAQPSEEATR